MNERLFDFDAAFEAYTAQWFHAHEKEYATLDAMEADMPEVYLRWLNEPCAELGGVAPGLYYDKDKNAQDLVALMCEYLESGIPVPDPLLERITSLDDSAEVLYALLPERYDAEKAERTMLAVNLLNELQSTLPLMRYIAWIASRTEKEDDISDAAAEALSSMGDVVVAPALAAYDVAQHAVARECLLDVLSNYPGDKGVYKRLARAFLAADDKVFLTMLLAKYGDEDAIGLLRRAAELPEVTYLEYMEMRHAVEALGGEWISEREFAGDPDYEALKLPE